MHGVHRVLRKRLNVLRAAQRAETADTGVDDLKVGTVAFPKKGALDVRRLQLAEHDDTRIQDASGGSVRWPWGGTRAVQAFPPVVGRSLVLMLSLTTIGSPARGGSASPRARLASTALAAASAPALFSAMRLFSEDRASALRLCSESP